MDIELLINIYGFYVFSYDLKLSGDTYVAEDLSQEIFINAWRKSAITKHIHLVKCYK